MKTCEIAFLVIMFLVPAIGISVTLAANNIATVEGNGIVS
jgi:hypothetical protein